MYPVLETSTIRGASPRFIETQAVVVAVGIDWDGRRGGLGVELASREWRASWTSFLMSL